MQLRLHWEKSELHSPPKILETCKIFVEVIGGANIKFGLGSERGPVSDKLSGNSVKGSLYDENTLL